MNSQAPLARTENLVVQDTSDEVLVYDLQTDATHCLNSTTAFVWSVCDGKNSLSEIESLSVKKFGQPLGDDFVRLALDSLNRAALLKNGDEITSVFRKFSRREAIKQVGLALLLALPLITSIIAPSAVSAQSGGAPPVGLACGERCTHLTRNNCPFNCGNCDGVGNCSVGAGVCVGIGSSCIATGTCDMGICTADFIMSCTVEGATCTAFGQCQGVGNCHI